MGILSNYRKNRAIKSYISKLPALLSRVYGQSQKFSPEQINEASKYLGLNLYYIKYALAVFSTRYEFNSYVGKAGLKWKYKILRKEVADKFWGGKTNFEIIFTNVNLYKGNADSELRGEYFRNR